MVFIASAIPALSQKKHVMQVSGVVVATDSLVPVSYTTIYRSSDKRGTYSDPTGYFTLPVEAGDTLNFVFLGLRKSMFLVPNDTTQTHVSIVQWMEEDTVNFPTVTILSYPAPHLLRRELLALDLPGDQYVKFSRSSPDARNYDGLYDLAETSTAGEKAILNARMGGNVIVSGGNLLDPSAWRSFMRTIKEGD